MKKIIAIGVILVSMGFRIQNPTEDIVGLEIKGDFKGSKNVTGARSGPIRQFYKDKNTDGVGWMVQFEDKTIPELTIGCCLSYMVNEGDLNKDGADELSIYAYSGDMEDCDYTFTTYTLSKKTGWQKIIGPFVVANGCKHVKDEALMKRVTLESNGTVYYNVDTLGKLVKTKAF